MRSVDHYSHAGSHIFEMVLRNVEQAGAKCSIERIEHIVRSAVLELMCMALVENSYYDCTKCLIMSGRRNIMEWRRCVY